eukprot:19443_1
MGKSQSSSPSTQDDSFIIQFAKNNNGRTQSTDVCPKRVIFISLIGLYQSYQQCPPHVLRSALLILPLKKEWIHSPSQYVTELHSASGGLIRCDTSSQELFELIKWKDTQGLVFWGRDIYDDQDNESLGLVHPFWQFVSHQLTLLYDPITSRNYEPLRLDPTALDVYEDVEVNSNDILLELYFVGLNYKCVKAILNTSNPEAFRVITSYHHARHEYVRINGMGGCDDGSEWWVAQDYL